jgi:hypothetical protein
VAYDLADYIGVNERILAFKKDNPEGSLQAEIVELTDKRVTVKAFAYRTPNDVRPGVGHSYLDIPGKTAFTRGSELENAETSAWGRALAAIGYEIRRSIASAEEVQSKQADTVTTDPLVVASNAAARDATGSATDAMRRKVFAEATKAGLTKDQLKALSLLLVKRHSSKDWSVVDVDSLLASFATEDPIIESVREVVSVTEDAPAA